MPVPAPSSFWGSRLPTSKHNFMTLRRERRHRACTWTQPTFVSVTATKESNPPCGRHILFDFLPSCGGSAASPCCSGGAASFSIWLCRKRSGGVLLVVCSEASNSTRTFLILRCVHSHQWHRIARGVSDEHDHALQVP